MSMNVAVKILIIIFLSFHAWALDIDENSSNLHILSHSFIYVDETNSLSKDEVMSKNFTQTSKDSLDFGIVPNTAVWVKFTLKNTSHATIDKILEYANPETEELLFFDGESLTQEGMFHHPKDRSTLNPIFNIKLKPLEEKTFFIKAECKISTLMVKLTLWNERDFVDYDYQHKIYIFIFFTIIATLLIYNFMLYIFTGYIVYFYYIVYLVAMLFFESVYLGVAQLYFFSNVVSTFVTQATIGYIVLLVIPMTLFAMEFLHTKRFKKIHTFLNLYLYALPIVAILSFDNFLFDLNIMLIFFPLAFTLIYSGFYALAHGTKEALFYLIGWTFVIISLTLSVLQSLGGYNIFEHFRYINEVAFALEALTFSIALAYRIKLLNAQKNEADKKLLLLMQKESQDLEALVVAKTLDLQNSLEEKEILYKELNHRVKNNLQMVLSLIKLQINKTNLEATREELTVTKNRINSISKLYELLYLKNDAYLFDTETYFKKIVKSIQENFDKDVIIEYDIRDEICLKSSIYCGLIINELVTNSFKYAFEQSGIITIRTYKEGGYVYMYIADNGVGFNEGYVASLGLNIVRALTQKQLGAEVITDTSGGVKTTIFWKEEKNE